MDENDFYRRLAALVDRLLQLTREGRIGWEVTDIVDCFEYGTPSASVYVQSRDRDQRAPYVLEIRNQDGVVVERFITDTASDPVVADLSAPIAMLHTLARRRAMRVSALLEALSNDLNQV